MPKLPPATAPMATATALPVKEGGPQALQPGAVAMVGPSAAQQQQEQQQQQQVVANNNAMSPSTVMTHSVGPVVASGAGPAVVTAPMLKLESRHPVQLSYCPHCQAQQVATRTKTKTSGPTWVAFAAGLVVFAPLCWVPFCIKGMKQTNHYCTACGGRVGRVKAFR